jgi:hypothetical protein
MTDAVSNMDHKDSKSAIQPKLVCTAKQTTQTARQILGCRYKEYTVTPLVQSISTICLNVTGTRAVGVESLANNLLLQQ